MKITIVIVSVIKRISAKEESSGYVQVNTHIYTHTHKESFFILNTQHYCIKYVIFKIKCHSKCYLEQEKKVKEKHN